MKKLSEVTPEDAKIILSTAYDFFEKGQWRLTDESENFGEPAVQFQSIRCRFYFWFMDDSIDIYNSDDDAGSIFNNLDDIHYDVKYLCYVKAVKLGYYVPELSELLNKNENKDSEEIPAT